MVAPGQLFHGPGYLFDSTLSLCSVLPLCVSGLSRTIPTLGTALGRSTPSWGPSGMGTPLGQPPVPPSCLTVVAGGAVSCRVEAPGPRIRAAHLAPSCCPPHSSLGPSTWGCGRPWPPPAPLLASRRHPAVIPGDRGGRGGCGLQMVPLAAAGPGPGDRGRRAGLGGREGAAGGGDVWRGYFPAQTDGAGLELQLPEGRVWIWHGVSTQHWKGRTDIRGWDGGDPMGHSCCVTGDMLSTSPK